MSQSLGEDLSLALILGRIAHELAVTRDLLPQTVDEASSQDRRRQTARRVEERLAGLEQVLEAIGSVAADSGPSEEGAAEEAGALRAGLASLRLPADLRCGLLQRLDLGR